MLQIHHDFDPAILPTGVPLTFNLLLRFRADVPQSPRRAVNLSLAIDRSGSMAGAALHHALKAAESVVDQLQPRDTLSVVVYDDRVNTIVPPQPVEDPASLKAAIAQVRAGGLTNLSGGWLQSCDHVKAHLDPQKINRVLLLTDGNANVGICNPQVLTATSGQKAEEAIVTTTLGFGQGFNEDLLISMARAAQGNFYFIQSIDEATQVFGIELDSLRAVVGQNLQVTLDIAPGVDVLEIFSLAEGKTNEAGQTEITLGELYEGEDKLLGLRLKMPPAAIGSHPLLTVHYRADVVQNNTIQGVAGQVAVMAPVGTIEESAQASSSEVILALSHLTIAKAKEMALDLAEQGKRQQAEQILRSVIAELHQRGLNETFEIAEEIEQLEYFADRIAQGALGNAGRKELRDQSFQTLTRNRSDLTARGVTAGEAIYQMPVVQEVQNGVELYCVREGGKLRIKVGSDGYDADKNVQFPRAIRAEGVRYVVEGLELSSDGSFYRVQGTINRLSKVGEVDQFMARSQGSRRSSSAPKASKGPASAADLATTDSVGDGILVQCVKDGTKLRARVVSDGYDPDWNMRFPRSVREEGMLYVVEAVKTGPDGKSYIACGDVKRFVQPTSPSPNPA